MRTDILLHARSPVRLPRHRPLQQLSLTCMSFLAVACSTTGVHDEAKLERIDFGMHEELRICVLADDGISEEEATSFVAQIGAEFSRFGLDVTVPWVRPWQRPAFLMQGIVADVWRRPLEPPCDRMLALVGRNFGDFLWGLFGVEILGAVDTPTHTRGYVIARSSSLNQLFSSPERTAIHEAYHLLGCTHETKLSSCYRRIRKLKQLAYQNRATGNDFFPSVSWTHAPITDRLQANARLREAIALSTDLRAHTHEWTTP